MENILVQIDKKLERLKEIYESGYPINPAHERRHEERVENAQRFYRELTDIKDELSTFNEQVVLLVPKMTMEKQIEKADFAEIYSDGEFCKIVSVQSFPDHSVHLLYIASIEAAV